MVESYGYTSGMGEHLCKSMALQVVFEYFTQSEKIKMQALNKRFYNSFVPSLVKSVQLYDMGNVQCGVVVFPGQEYINILEATATDSSLCDWKKVPFDLVQTEHDDNKPMMQDKDDGGDSDDHLTSSDEEDKPEGQTSQMTKKVTRLARAFKSLLDKLKANGTEAQ